MDDGGRPSLQTPFVSDYPPTRDNISPPITTHSGGRCPSTLTVSLGAAFTPGLIWDGWFWAISALAGLLGDLTHLTLVLAMVLFPFKGQATGSFVFSTIIGCLLGWGLIDVLGLDVLGRNPGLSFLLLAFLCVETCEVGSSFTFLRLFKHFLGLAGSAKL